MKPVRFLEEAQAEFLDQVLYYEEQQGFGWTKTVGDIRQVMVRGLKRVDRMFVLTMAAYNMVRMRSLGQVRPLSAQ